MGGEEEVLPDHLHPKSLHTGHHSHLDHATGLHLDEEMTMLPGDCLLRQV